ncbi:MMPL family transporter [Gulosibacter molinativorax]|uniref:MMPL family transporter n=1 Tax=Gulosibacter molinativorax TaxID=256821 RepID=A0ABT7CBP2_9MICO|nr:MMPL family transporter [Gulosibacter molinativorax]MDJ1372620.1 MMPL family transporter [Gulosibacter molinativorax]QUY62596.1 Membrane protein YdfJ [Gulosibacter molinativorax]
MALLLYRIGKFSFRNRWPVLIAWLALFAAALGLGLGLGGEMKEDFEIPGTQSQDALDRLGEVFPEVSGASAEVVILAEDGTIADRRDAIADVSKELGDVGHVVEALDPFSQYATGALSDDGKAAVIRVQFDTNSMSDLVHDKEAVVDIASGLEAEGLTVEYGGQLYQDLEYGLTASEALGVVFAAVVLIVTFGSVVAAGLPLASALIAVGVTMGVLLFVTRFITVSSASPLLAVMIGIAVGIDYALFILSRHRNQLAKGEDVEESAATAVGTSGSAVTFAAATVMVALLGLLIVGIPFLSVMGVAAAGGVFMALCTSLTLLPALFGFAGERLRPKQGSRAWLRETGQNEKPTMGRRWVRIVLKAPWVFVVLVIGVLGALAIPALHMQTSLPSGKGEAVGSTARDAYDIVAEHFGEGANGPMLVMLDITQVNNESLMSDLEAISDLVASTPGVESAGSAIPNRTVDSAIIQVIPTTGPDDPATLDTVNALRDLGPQIETDYGAVSSVTGATAVQIDITNRLNNALLPFAGVVVGLSFVLLMMVFRSVLVPLKAALSFLLSAFAAFGVVVLIFQDGILGEVMGIVPGPIIAFLPIILLAIVFGLAMDYEVFLVSGMREAHVRGAGARDAIEEGFANAARVVTAAALIMFFVFIAFVPEGAGVIKVIALGLAAGIAFDAFLVRMTLVPALMALFGERAWTLPKWLDRILPDLDIEGEALREYRERAAWAREHHAAIALEDLRVGDGKYTSVTCDVPEGGILAIRGGMTGRRLLEATLAGRIDPFDGRAQILGHTVPGDGGGLVSQVSLCNLDGMTDRARALTLGQLIGRHGAYGRVTARAEISDAEVRVVLDELNAALRAAGHEGGLRATTRLDALDPLARSVALAGIAVVEIPKLLVLDFGSVAVGEPGARLVTTVVRAVSRLVNRDVTLAVGVDDSVDLEPQESGLADLHRPIVTISIHREPALVGAVEDPALESAAEHPVLGKDQRA